MAGKTPKTPTKEQELQFFQGLVEKNNAGELSPEQVAQMQQFANANQLRMDGTPWDAGSESQAVRDKYSQEALTNGPDAQSSTSPFTLDNGGMLNTVDLIRALHFNPETIKRGLSDGSVTLTPEARDHYLWQMEQGRLKQERTGGNPPLDRWLSDPRTIEFQENNPYNPVGGGGSPSPTPPSVGGGSPSPTPPSGGGGGAQPPPGYQPPPSGGGGYQPPTGGGGGGGGGGGTTPPPTGGGGGGGGGGGAGGGLYGPPIPFGGYQGPNASLYAEQFGNLKAGGDAYQHNALAAALRREAQEGQQANAEPWQPDWSWANLPRVRTNAQQPGEAEPYTWDLNPAYNFQPGTTTAADMLRGVMGNSVFTDSDRNWFNRAIEDGNMENDLSWALYENPQDLISQFDYSGDNRARMERAINLAYVRNDLATPEGGGPAAPPPGYAAPR